MDAAGWERAADHHREAAFRAASHLLDTSVGHG
jgi:hypothetical protein